LDWLLGQQPTTATESTTISLEFIIMSGGDTTSRVVKGRATIFSVSTSTGLISNQLIKTRLLPADLEEGLGVKKGGISLAFIANTNLHSLPNQCRGTLCVVKYHNYFRLAIVVQALSFNNQCTFIIQRHMNAIPSFWYFNDFHTFNLHSTALLEHFYVHTSDLKDIYCRVVNQIHGPRTKLLHGECIARAYPFVDKGDQKINMHPDGPDICKSPSTKAAAASKTTNASSKPVPVTKPTTPSQLTAKLAIPKLQFHSCDNTATAPRLKKPRLNKKQRAKMMIPVLYVLDAPLRKALICDCGRFFSEAMPLDPQCTCVLGERPKCKRSFLGLPIRRIAVPDSNK
jgi:hypothetical protein